LLQLRNKRLLTSHIFIKMLPLSVPLPPFYVTVGNTLKVIKLELQKLFNTGPPPSGLVLI